MRCERLVSFVAYYVLVMRLSDVMLSTQLLLVVFDLSYDLSSENLQLYRTAVLKLKQYPVQHSI